MRRTALASAAILVAATMLGACGDDGSDASSDSSGGDVEVMTWWTEGGEKAGLDALIQLFDSQYPDQLFIGTDAVKAALRSAINRQQGK